MIDWLMTNGNAKLIGRFVIGAVLLAGGCAAAGYPLSGLFGHFFTIESRADAAARLASESALRNEGAVSEISRRIEGVDDRITDIELRLRKLEGVQ